MMLSCIILLSIGNRCKSLLHQLTVLGHNIALGVKCISIKPLDLCDVISRPRGSVEHLDVKEGRLDAIDFCAITPVVNFLACHIHRIGDGNASLLLDLSAAVLLKGLRMRMGEASDQPVLVF